MSEMSNPWHVHGCWRPVALRPLHGLRSYDTPPRMQGAWYASIMRPEANFSEHIYVLVVFLPSSVSSMWGRTKTQQRLAGSQRFLPRDRLVCKGNHSLNSRPSRFSEWMKLSSIVFENQPSSSWCLFVENMGNSYPSSPRGSFHSMDILLALLPGGANPGFRLCHLGELFERSMESMCLVRKGCWTLLDKETDGVTTNSIMSQNMS